MRYYIGIDIGGTNLAVGIVDENANLIAKHSVPTGAERPAEALINDMAAASRKAAELAGVSWDDIESVGIGVPGACDLSDMSVMLAVNLGWKNVPLGNMLGEMLDKPVYLGNDADCAALGEAKAGCAKDCQSAIMITIGTGLGCGIILNGKIFTGGTLSGTEPGHVAMIFGGEKCGCGKNGCIEAYTSCTALIRQTKAAMENNADSLMWKYSPTLDAVDGRTPFDAAKAGDKAALEVLDTYTTYLACGISSFINILRPEMVIVGGGVSAQGDYLLDPVRAKMRDYVYGVDLIAPPPVKAAVLGNDAGIIGAALINQ